MRSKHSHSRTNGTSEKMAGRDGSAAHDVKSEGDVTEKMAEQRPLKVLAAEHAVTFKRVRRKHARTDLKATREHISSALSINEKCLFEMETGNKRWPGCILGAGKISPHFREELAEETLASVRVAATDDYSVIALEKIVKRVERFSELGNHTPEQRDAIASLLEEASVTLHGLASMLKEDR